VEIVPELEDSGREAGLALLSTRVIKEELIEEEETVRERRNRDDEMVANNSMDVIERIVIEDRMEGEACMIRTVGQVVRIEEDEPTPPKELVTPVMGSTPIAGHENERERVTFRQLTAPKRKLWVPAEPDDQRSEGESEGDSGNESFVSRRSPKSAVSSERKKVVEGDEERMAQRLPRGYGARSTRVQINVNEMTGLREISATDDGDEMWTGGGGDGNFGVRKVTARSWLKGGELGVGGTWRTWRINCSTRFRPFPPLGPCPVSCESSPTRTEHPGICARKSQRCCCRCARQRNTYS